MLSILNLQSRQYKHTKMCGPQIRELGGKKTWDTSGNGKKMISQNLGALPQDLVMNGDPSIPLTHRIHVILVYKNTYMDGWFPTVYVCKCM